MMNKTQCPGGVQSPGGKRKEVETLPRGGSLPIGLQ